MIYGTEIFGLAIIGFFLFIITTVFAVFSPFGIGFIIFSIIRHKTENENLKKISLIFQIILTALTFLIGILASLLFVIRGSPFYTYGSQALILTGAIIFGTIFISVIAIIVIIWQTRSVENKLSPKSKSSRL